MEDEVCAFVIPGELVLTTSSILSLLLFITVVDVFTKNKTDGLSSKFLYVICSLQATKKMKSRNLATLEIIIFKYQTICLAKKTLGKTQELKCWTSWNDWINLLFLWMSNHKEKSAS